MRWLTEEDAPLMLAIWNDPAFIRHVGDRGVRDIEQARQAMRDGILKVYRDQRMGPYGLFLHGSDEAMGICGLFKRDNLEYPRYRVCPASELTAAKVTPWKRRRPYATTHGATWG